MTFNDGRTAANGQPVTPGWVPAIVFTSADPLVPGKFMSFMLFRSPSLRCIDSLRTGLLGRVKCGARCAVAWNRQPFTFF